MTQQVVNLTRDEVRRVDRIATERFAVPGIVLMENAARAVTQVAVKMRPLPAAVLLLCGGGNNGGDGFAIARHLANLGYFTDIAMTVPPEKYTGDALTNWRIVEAMHLPARRVENAAELLREKAHPSLIIDAVFGTGLSQPPRSPFDELAAVVNASGIPVLAVDVPSGLDCDTGRPFGACIRATRTVTFVAMKRGFLSPESRQWTGEVVVGDIGCPLAAIEMARTGG